MSALITYKIVSDKDGKLKNSAKLSCTFWNRYILPNSSIVIRLGVFTSFGNTIARAYKPQDMNGVKYGQIEFNTNFLDDFSEEEIVGTVIHEIGHTLGFGWDRWMELFDKNTGTFHQEHIDIVPDLFNMRVETDYDPGTTLAHWDEEKFDKELMTGFMDNSVYVLPVTIDVISLLGHIVAERLPSKQMLVDIINELKNIQFTRVDEAKDIDRDYFEETEIWEEIYTDKRHPFEL